MWVPTIYVLSKNKKIVKYFQMKIVIFMGVKNRCLLHGRVSNTSYNEVVNILEYRKICRSGKNVGYFGHGHFGHGHFGKDISATDISAM